MDKTEAFHSKKYKICLTALPVTLHLSLITKLTICEVCVLASWVVRTKIIRTSTGSKACLERTCRTSHEVVYGLSLLLAASTISCQPSLKKKKKQLKEYLKWLKSSFLLLGFLHSSTPPPLYKRNKFQQLLKTPIN